MCCSRDSQLPVERYLETLGDEGDEEEDDEYDCDNAQDHRSDWA